MHTLVISDDGQAVSACTGPCWVFTFDSHPGVVVVKRMLGGPNPAMEFKVPFPVLLEFAGAVLANQEIERIESISGSAFIRERSR